MESVLPTLPSRPVQMERIFELMEPPRQGVGFVNPALANHDTGNCVCAYLEYKGQMTAIAFNGTTWVELALDNEFTDVDAALHDDRDAEQLVDLTVKAGREVIGFETQPVDPSVQSYAPPGYQSKMCIRHRPLSQQDYAELEQWPQFADCEPIYGNLDSGIVGVVLAERSLDLDYPTTVFLYYNPSIGTWRIVDSIPMPELRQTGDQLHQETRKRLAQHYDQLDMLVGPDDNN